MWEVLRFTSQGGISVRRFLTSVLAVFVAVFLSISWFSTPVSAATDAGWDGDQIVHNSNKHKKTPSSSSTPSAVATNPHYYMHMGTDGTASVIYFNAGANPDTATTGFQASYSYDINGIRGSPLKGPVQISITPKSQSASSTNAAWSGVDLEFDGRSYKGASGQPRIANGSTPPGLAKDAQYYSSYDTDGVVRIIFFDPGANVTAATTAKHQEFNGNINGIGSARGPATDITVTPAADSPNGGTTGEGAGNKCAVNGIGWFVCPVSEFLAWGMDQIFNMLKGFLEVTPLSTDTNSPLYKAWSLVRTIANVAFVLAFMIIIYSQLTNMWVDNYSIKKLLPRLILAALAVNLSYFICAVFVDISNIVGVATHDLLVGMRETLNGPNVKSIASWESVTGYVLSSGVAQVAGAVAIGGVIVSTGASLGAALILLLPMLLGLLIAVLVALLVLAARQALIIILIILAPLAFVAYLLPNTEKLFDKWRSIFTTMLVFYPLFALIFGGSQLAAFLIIQTAEDINVILLAMFVQVAPLVLTPILVRFSGGIIGKIAGFVNDPKKGLIDRTRNWAQEQSQYMAAQNMARRDPVRPHQVFRRFARTFDEAKRGQADRLKSYQEYSDARWSNTREYSDIHQRLRYAQDLKETGTNRAELRYESSKNLVGQTQRLDEDSRMVKARLEDAKATSDIRWEANTTARIAEQRTRTRVMKDQLAAIQSTRDAEYEEFKRGFNMGPNPINARVGALMNQSQLDTRLMALNALRLESAKRAITEEFTHDIERNIQRVNGQSLQMYAGGVQGIDGAQRALATAISQQEHAEEEAVKNATAILKHNNLHDSVITRIALGDSAGTGITITQDMREAATIKIAGGKNTDEIINLMRDIEINRTPENERIRKAFHDSLMANGDRPKWASAGIMAQVKQGAAPATGDSRIDAWIIETFNAHKWSSAETIVSEDKSYLAELARVIRTKPGMLKADAIASFKQQLQIVFTDNRYLGRIGDRRQILSEIRRLLP